MFTGIVEAAVPTLRWEPAGHGGRLLLPAPAVADWRVRRGQSIAVSGACLTVADLLEGGSDGAPVPEGRPLPDRAAGAAMLFELSSETLERTWLGELRPGRAVNLERALRIGDRLDGHMVSGHVDGCGEIAQVEEGGDGGRRFAFDLGRELAPFLVDKGSVTLDGISLTVLVPRAVPDGVRFEVAVVPHTLAVTTLGEARVGQRVNVEVDLVARWVRRLMG